MRVLIITCYESNEERVSFVLDVCKKRNYDVKVVTTDFSHIKKEKRTNIPNDYITINTKPYNKNISLERILSHSEFAKDAFALARKEKPDLMWIMAPANSLIKEASKYKKQYPNTKLIIDIIDMWPESLPINMNKNMLPFKIWKNVRKKYINCADALVTECDLYHDILKEEYTKNITTIYWARQVKVKYTEINVTDSNLSLCYIGSINNIIGIDLMCNIIKNIDMPVTLHIIGEGENTDNFISKLSGVCEVIYHGAIRDENAKKEIFAKCHAGLNIYKEDLYIGLTVKSIDYLQYGLPIINNIKGDTWKMIDKYKVGINVDSNTRINIKDIIEMRNNNQNIYELFEANFTKDAFDNNCNEVIDGVIK